MPRPKSELTLNQKRVTARLTQEDFKEWRKLGGSLWLREYLRRSAQQRKEKP